MVERRQSLNLSLDSSGMQNALSWPDSSPTVITTARPQAAASPSSLNVGAAPCVLGPAEGENRSSGYRREHPSTMPKRRHFENTPVREDWDSKYSKMYSGRGRRLSLRTGLTSGGLVEWVPVLLVGYDGMIDSLAGNVDVVLAGRQCKLLVVCDGLYDVETHKPIAPYGNEDNEHPRPASAYSATAVVPSLLGKALTSRLGEVRDEWSSIPRHNMTSLVGGSLQLREGGDCTTARKPQRPIEPRNIILGKDLNAGEGFAHVRKRGSGSTRTESKSSVGFDILAYDEEGGRQANSAGRMRSAAEVSPFGTELTPSPGRYRPIRGQRPVYRPTSVPKHCALSTAAAYSNDGPPIAMRGLDLRR
ncbi:hypothetical protein FOL47_007544 [Perkinsus chesapeaki]|uniref:Uncharacterized protein n=1 Tax=Perkinsus chesapeaki TaxID=330153 RepID=A0A7J6MVE2_PERCH|nr:hypothetical protein FOL47_007544 [Perkinsus chesapeaki]